MHPSDQRILDDIHYFCNEYGEDIRLGKLVDTMDNLSVPVLQGIWSDEEGKFPMQEGFDPNLQGKQFFLNQAPE